MAQRIIMPKQGNTVEAVILLEWKKNEGDPVEEGEILCEVETDKATFEIPSSASGTLLKKLYDDGDDVPVMTEFAVIGEPGEEGPEAAGAGGEAEGATDAAAAGAAGGPAAAGTPAAGAPRAPQGSIEETPLTGKRDVRISPLARRTASELGVPEAQYSDISGTGPGGRILRRDVEAFAESGAAAAAGAAGDWAAGAPTGAGAAGGAPATGAAAARTQAARTQAAAPLEAEVAETRKVTGVRKVISERMLASLTQTAQLTLNATADASALMGYRKKLKAAPEHLGVGDITVNDIVMFIAARTAARHPAVNAHYVEGDPDEIRSFRGVNLGFAVDAERGLYVPVIRGADSLSLRQLADRAHELAATVHAGKAGPEHLDGGTFTVTNLGAFGVRDFTPVLNPPEVAILGVGTVRPEQAYRGDEVVTVPHIGLSLTFDHRAVDGGPAARFLQDICAAVANAESVLAL
jgi:pyruvate dehydrogenase E2 component (dihydrolipoamide acetyltransferase)